MGPKKERSFAKGLETEARSCKQRDAKRVQRPRWMVWTRKVIKIRWNSVMTDIENNFVWDPGFNWKPMECSEQ